MIHWKQILKPAHACSDYREGGDLFSNLEKAFDKGYSVLTLRAMAMTPHVAHNLNRNGGSANDGRTTRHDGYTLSQRIRKRIEEPFGWAKQIGELRQTKFRSAERVRQDYLKVMSVYNLVRIRNLLPELAW